MGSKIYGGSESNFEPASIDIHDAVCAEFVDQGEQDTPYGRKHKGYLVFQVDEEIEDGDYAGQRKEVRLYFTMTLGTSQYPSKIRGIIEKWRGKKITDKEVEDGFDLSVLEGKPCRLDVNHKVNKDGSRTYAVVDGITKAGQKKLKVKDYTPIAKRQGAPTEADDSVADDADDDLPF